MKIHPICSSDESWKSSLAKKTKLIPAIQVLQGLQSKSFLEAQAVTEIEEVLKERDTAAHDMGLSSPAAAAANGDAELGDMPPSQTLPQPRWDRGSSSAGANAGAGAARLDRKQVEQRIEEDRERHKRLREGIWAVPPGPDAELDRLWEETSDLGDDDHLMGEEEYEERERTVRSSCVHRQAAAAAEANGKHSR